MEIAARFLVIGDESLSHLNSVIFAVSSFLAGLCGVMMAYSTTTLSPTSFMVIGWLHFHVIWPP